MSTEARAKALYDSDNAHLVEISADPRVFPNVGKSWEEVADKVKNAYYGFVAEGDYNIEFEEDNND